MKVESTACSVSPTADQKVKNLPHFFQGKIGFVVAC